MSPEQLSGVAGILLSLLFSYLPGAKGWFEQFKPEQKRLMMLALIAITSVAAFGLSCAGEGMYFVCSQAGVWELLRAFAAAAVANQITYKLSPQLQGS